MRRSIGWIVLATACVLMTACSVPVASLYVKSQSCRDGFSSAAAAIVLRDQKEIDFAKAATAAKNDADRTQLLHDLSSSVAPIVFAKSIARYVPVDREFSSFYVSMGEAHYDFLVQNGEENTCWLRLYKKKDGGFSYANTMTFIDSEQVRGCACSGNQVHLGL